MMCRIIFLAWILAWAAMPGVAQEVLRVRAGEHSTYSRLVVPVPAGTEWQFTSAGRRAELFVPLEGSQFDYQAVFDRIPKTRILSLSEETTADGARLRLALACSCKAVASLSGRYLVIDVQDPSAESADPEVAEAALPAPQPRPVPARDAPPVEADPAEPPNNIADQLISQLERAAAQGLVDLQDDDDPATVVLPETPSDEGTATDPADAAPPETALKPRQENLDGLEGVSERLARAFDKSGESEIGASIRLTVPEEETTIARRPARPAKEKGPPEQDVCGEQPLFDLSLYDAKKEPVDQIVALRSEIVGEFDAPNREVAVDLAKLYIALGFSNEADVVIGEFLPDDPRGALLKEMAGAVNGERATIGGELDQLAPCPGLAALWRTAAFSRDETQPVRDPDSVITELAETPLSLRRQLTPRIVEAFLARGQVNAAKAAFAILDRGPGFHGNEHEFQRAMLFAEDGEFARAEALLSSLFATDQPIAPRAGVALVKSLVNRGEIVPENLIENIEAAAMLYRDNELGVELRKVEILAKSGTGRLQDALGIVKREILRTPDFRSDYIDAADRILSNLATDPLPHGEFATTIFEHMDLVADRGVTDSTRTILASAMLQAGLPQAALEVLAEIHDKSAPSPLARDLAANAHLVADAPDEVLSLLGAETNGQSELLRAGALAKLGMHEDAYRAARAAQSDEMSQFAWRAGEWQDVAGEGTRGAMAAYMLARSEERPLAPFETDEIGDTDVFLTATPDGSDPSLVTANRLRTQSAAIRKTIRALIETDATN